MCVTHPTDNTFKVISVFGIAVLITLRTVQKIQASGATKKNASKGNVITTNFVTNNGVETPNL
jgi:hypothetical protein